jgi:hypothetical protein
MVEQGWQHPSQQSKPKYCYVLIRHAAANTFDMN